MWSEEADAGILKKVIGHKDLRITGNYFQLANELMKVDNFISVFKHNEIKQENQRCRLHNDFYEDDRSNS
jgi:hypothetical protein